MKTITLLLFIVLGLANAPESRAVGGCTNVWNVKQVNGAWPTSVEMSNLVKGVWDALTTQEITNGCTRTIQNGQTIRITYASGVCPDGFEEPITGTYAKDPPVYPNQTCAIECDDWWGGLWQSGVYRQCEFRAATVCPGAIGGVSCSLTLVKHSLADSTCNNLVGGGDEEALLSQPVGNGEYELTELGIKVHKAKSAYGRAARKDEGAIWEDADHDPLLWVRDGPDSWRITELGFQVREANRAFKAALRAAKKSQ